MGARRQGWLGVGAPGCGSSPWGLPVPGRRAPGKVQTLRLSGGLKLLGSPTPSCVTPFMSRFTKILLEPKHGHVRGENEFAAPAFRIRAHPHVPRQPDASPSLCAPISPSGQARPGKRVPQQAGTAP